MQPAGAARVAAGKMLRSLAAHLGDSAASPTAAAAPPPAKAAAVAPPRAPTLCAADWQQWQEKGLIVLPGVLPAAEVARYRSMADALVAQARGMTEDANRADVGYSVSLGANPANDGKQDGFLHKVQGVSTLEPRFLEIARYGPILAVLQELLGEKELDIFGTKFFPKLPGGISVNWHQDNFAFGQDVHADRAKQEQIISLAVYLEHSDEESGCLRVIPSSHRHGYLAPPANAFQNSATLEPHRDLTLPTDAPPLEAARNVPLTAGSCVVFSANLLHGALPNHSAVRSRYGLFWHYLPRQLQPEKFRSGDFLDRHEL